MRKYMAFVMLVASSMAWAQEQSVAAPRLLRAEELRTAVDQNVLQRQYDALLGMSLEMVTYSPRGPIEDIVGETGIVLPHDTAERKKNDDASDLLPLLKDVLLANGTETLTVRDNSIVFGSDKRSLELAQSIRGIPVANGNVSLEYNVQTKRVSIISAHFVPDRNLPRAPKLSAQQAEEFVRQALESTEGAKVHIRDGTYLAYYAEFAEASPPQLVWAMEVVFPYAIEIYFTNAITGLVVAREKRSMEVTRKVYDISDSTLPYFPSGLPPALNMDQINAQQYRKEGYDYVEQADEKLRLRIPEYIAQFPSKVHILVRYGSPGFADAAPFGSEDYLRFGGTNSTYHHVTHARDNVAHEFAHGIGFRNFGTTGDPSDQQHHALHESFADISATVVDVAINAVPNSLTWIIGDQSYKANDFEGHRSFANPGSDPLARFSTADWFPSRAFWQADPHYNSTIVSHASVVRFRPWPPLLL